MLKTIKILAIDHEEIILKSIKKALKNNGEVTYDITTCNTALEGLKIIRSDTFNLVFVDLVLPGMNGIEVLRRIKNIQPALPVIIMSGYSSLGIYPGTGGKGISVNESLNNASGFLLKPFTSDEIIFLVKKVLE